MVNCYKFKQQISNYIDRELSFHERQMFDQHRENCPSCQKLLQSIQSTQETMTNFSKVKLSEDFMTNLREKILTDRNARIIASEKTGLFSQRVPKLTYGFGVALLAVVIVFSTLQINKHNAINQAVQPMAEKKQESAPQLQTQQRTPPVIPQNFAGVGTKAIPSDTTINDQDKNENQTNKPDIDYQNRIKTVGDRR